MTAVLRQRNFALLWIGQMISSLGDWVLWIALPFFVYEQTGSALATGAMFVVQTLPPILFGSLAGVFADRWDRRWTMVIADLMRAILLLLMLIALLPGWLWILYPLAFVDSIVEQFFKAAKNALIPSVAGKEHLLAANRLNSLSGDLTMLIGPALGGTLVGFIGIANVILIDALSFLFSAWMIYLICVSPAAERALSNEETSVISPVVASIWQEWLAGFQEVKHERLLFALFTIMGVAMLGQGIISVSWVIFVREDLAGGPFEYGVVQVAVAAGGIVGAFLLGRASRAWSPSYLIAFSGMVTGLLLLSTFNLPYLPAILLLQFGMGIVAVGFFVTINTLLQSNTPNPYLGRVSGVYQATSAFLVLCGQGLASALGDRVSTVFLLDVAAGFYFLSGVVALLMLTVHGNQTKISWRQHT
jgi:MFS family permease